MGELVAHTLRVRARAQSNIYLGRHKGPAIRGAFFGVLRSEFCAERNRPSCSECPQHAACPVSALVATVDDESSSGVDVARPFVIEPPLDGRTVYEPGEHFDFGLTIFGRGLQLFPWAIMALQSAGRLGIGRLVEREGGRATRGTFTLERVEAVHPFSGERRDVKREGERVVHVPDLPVTPEQVASRAASLPPDEVTLDLLTPLRLISEGRLVHRLEFLPLFLRLRDRLRELWARYGEEEPPFGEPALYQAARGIVVRRDGTCWHDLRSYSQRQGRSTPIGGHVGRITFAGALEPLLPLLVWGEVAHCGKDTTKGCGWYRIVPGAAGRQPEGQVAP